MSTELKPCKCKHTFQDQEYGKQLRLHNQGIKHYTCTVCGDKKLSKGDK